MKKHVNELQMQKYFLGMLYGPKASLSANNLDIHQKQFLPTLCGLFKEQNIFEIQFAKILSPSINVTFKSDLVNFNWQNIDF